MHACDRRPRHTDWQDSEGTPAPSGRPIVVRIDSGTTVVHLRRVLVLQRIITLNPRLTQILGSAKPSVVLSVPRFVSVVSDEHQESAGSNYDNDHDQHCY